MFCHHMYIYIFVQKICKKKEQQKHVFILIFLRRVSRFGYFVTNNPFDSSWIFDKAEKKDSLSQITEFYNRQKL